MIKLRRVSVTAIMSRIDLNSDRYCCKFVQGFSIVEAFHMAI